MVHPANDYIAPLLLTRADTHEGMELREMPFIGVDLDWYNEVARRIPWPRGGYHPDTMSFVSLEPATLILSAVRQTADGSGMVVRFYNPTGEAVTAQLNMCCEIAAAHRLNLNEERQESLPYIANTLSVHVKSGQIVTVEICPQPA